MTPDRPDTGEVRAACRHCGKLVNLLPAYGGLVAFDPDGRLHRDHCKPLRREYRRRQRARRAR